MSYDESPTEKQAETLPINYWIWIGIGPVLLIVVVVLLFALGGISKPSTQRTVVRAEKSESGWETARESLSRKTDVNSCRGALQQINVELNEKPQQRPPALTKEQKQWLREKIEPNEEEWTEIESANCTRLDSAHLERCFLLRDAARALEVKALQGQMDAEPPLSRASRAFAWVMRQVRLRQGESEEAPAAYVLRRGWGTAGERALVFLALLEQIGDRESLHPELLGCLLEVPRPAGGMSLWACGVVVGDGKDVYVFDPRLGLPLPGPDGKGVATLSALRKQPELLAQLSRSDKLAYDVTAEQMRAAQARLVCPLSALTPRMLYLQQKVLPPVVNVRLGVDAASEVERLKSACASAAEKPLDVGLSKDKTFLLRRFLPSEEGGKDTGARKQRFTMDLIPRQAMPPQVQDERKYPPNSALGKRVHALFAAPFLAPTLEPGFARDLLLRGRYNSAVSALVNERESWRNRLEQRANAVDLEKSVDEWWKNAVKVYADQARGKQSREKSEEAMKSVWGDRQGLPIYLLLESAAAIARGGEAAYQLGLCGQEKAEQAQARLNLPSRDINEAAHRQDVDKAKEAWQFALNGWKQFEEESPNHPDSGEARLLRGRAEAMLGDRAAALRSWKDVSGFRTDLQKIASLYLAQQLEKQPR